MTNYPGLGTDIELDINGNFVVDTTGDLQITQDEKCILQGVRHRITTPNSSLFYDVLYGFDFYKYLHIDNDELTQDEFCEDVKNQLRLEPRVKQGTEDCEVLSWNENSIRFMISFVPIEMTTPINLVLNANMTDMSIIVEGE